MQNATCRGGESDVCSAGVPEGRDGGRVTDGKRDGRVPACAWEPLDAMWREMRCTPLRSLDARHTSPHVIALQRLPYLCFSFAL